MLPLRQPFLPMEAISADEIPRGKNWHYEPKWDGFRCLVFRDGNKIELQSKSGQSLTRYFPDIVAAVSELATRCCVMDGEIVVPNGQTFSFEKLLQRIHPAATRIANLSRETPAMLIAFDLLVDAKGNALNEQPLKTRRQHLEAFAKKYLSTKQRIRLSPATTRITQA